MTIVLVGFNPNGEKCLQALVEHGFPPRLVVSPQGANIEGMQRLAEVHGLPFCVTSEFAVLEKALRELGPDLVVVASYPRLFPPEILRLPRQGTLNVHTSALPRWRGIHPLNWAMIHGDETMGVTVHFMDEGMDSGDIVAQEVVSVGIEDDINTMREKLTTIGARLLVNVVREIAQGRAVRRRQDHARATLAPRRGPEESQLDWGQSSRELFNFCRALYAPYPNAFSQCRGEVVRVEKVHVSAQPGTILAKAGTHDYVVATGDGTVFVRLDRDDLEAGDRLVR